MVDTMTSWFSVSDALTRVAVMVCVVCVTGGQLGAVQGTLRIPQCSAQRWLDVHEDADFVPYMGCEGFSAQQIVNWRIVRNNTVVANYTCGPLPSTPPLRCSETSSDIDVYRSTDTRSDLYIKRNRRDLASNGRVGCYVDDYTSVAICRTNVISPAVLSDCEVTMTTHQTLAGTCNFNNAYSSNGTYTCTWTLTPTDRQGSPDIIISGDINKTEQTSGGKLYYKGTCSFTALIPAGHYTYIVRFFPGKPGHQYEGSGTAAVPPTTTEPTTTRTVPTTRPTTEPRTTRTVPTTRPTTEPRTTRTVPPTTTESTSTTESSTTKHHVQTSDSSESSSTAQSTTDSSSFAPSKQGGDNDGADQCSCTAVYIAVGVVAAVVVIVAVVVVVILVRRYLGRRLYDRPRRRKRRQPEEHPYTGLTVYETVGQPAPSTSHVQDTAQSVYEIPDQESGPGVDLSQTNTAFTPDPDGKKQVSNASQPYENESPPESYHPNKNDSQPGSSSLMKENSCSPGSSHPYYNDSPSDPSHPYKNDPRPE